MDNSSVSHPGELLIDLTVHTNILNKKTGVQTSQRESGPFAIKSPEQLKDKKSFTCLHNINKTSFYYIILILYLIH